MQYPDNERERVTNAQAEGNTDINNNIDFTLEVLREGPGLTSDSQSVNRELLAAQGNIKHDDPVTQGTQEHWSPRPSHPLSRRVLILVRSGSLFCPAEAAVVVRCPGDGLRAANTGGGYASSCSPLLLARRLVVGGGRFWLRGGRSPPGPMKPNPSEGP